MIWLTWRQYRMNLVYIAAMLAAVGAFLVPTGLHRFDLFHDSGLAACVSAGRTCPDLHGPLDQAYDTLSPIVGWFHLVPVVVGVLLAAPLIGELEHRTFRLAWTQGVTRERWLASNLGAALVAVAAFALVFTAAMTWWYAPYDRSTLLLKAEVGQSFDFEGLMPLSYTLFAFALALAAGVISRRMLAAPLVALVGSVVLILAMERFVQPSLGTVHVQGVQAFPTGPGAFFRAPSLALRNMDRFWTAQGIEAAVFLSAAVALIGLSVWLIARRA